MRDGVCELIKTENVRDENGIIVQNEIRKDCVCRISSVSMTEFYEGGRNGLKPEYRVDIFRGDYEGEKEVELEGRRLFVYRVYESDLDTMELYLESRGGTVGKKG